jgi:hypothetical protein
MGRLTDWQEEFRDPNEKKNQLDEDPPHAKGDQRRANPVVPLWHDYYLCKSITVITTANTINA